MNTLLLDMRAPICWKVGKADPSTFKVDWEPRYEILNPLLTLESEGEHTGLTMLAGDEAMFRTNRLGLRVSNLEKNFGKLHSDLSTFIAEFLGACRFVSKQYGLPRRFEAIIRPAQSSESLPIPSFPKRGSLRVAMRGDIWESALAWKHLIRADKIVQNGGILNYHNILLDAFEAYNSEDYKRTILYAAIAIESMAAEELENHYKALLAQPSSGPSWRVIEVDTSQGGTVRKDPIYHRLAQKDDFGALLHERPLYLLGRSLLIDDQSTFRIAKEVYKTRNNIAHRGDIAADMREGLLPIDRKGAQKALDCTLAVFRWFEVESDYVVPHKVGIIEGTSAEFQLNRSPNPGHQADG